MAKLSETDRKDLGRNPNVLKVTESNVSYSPDFKVKAVKDYLSGMSPLDIFKNANIDISAFDEKYPFKTIKRWKLIFTQEGKDGFSSEKRGRKKAAIKKKSHMSKDEEIRHLKMELFIVKKLNALAESKKKKGLK